MNYTKDFEFWQWKLVCPTTGAIKLAKNLDNWYVGEEMNDTIEQGGTSCLCTFNLLAKKYIGQTGCTLKHRLAEHWWAEDGGCEHLSSC